MSTQVLERELDRLEGLWPDGLSDAYHEYLAAISRGDADGRMKQALAAALVEVGVRLQGLGGRAAAPPALLMGDLCLARASRLLADAAPVAVQVAFARTIEALSQCAASGTAAPPARELLLQALEARA